MKRRLRWPIRGGDKGGRGGKGEEATEMAY